VTPWILVLLLFAAHAPTLPDHAKTPGVVAISDVTKVCGVKWGTDRRFVTESMKKQVAANYGIARNHLVGYGKGPCCEIDHLIPRELGGADDIRNLWAQPWKEAKQKDRLENRLHVLVCHGTLTLEQAQTAIRTDWTAAFRHYVP
jgi:hypothetical protein